MFLAEELSAFNLINEKCADYLQKENDNFNRIIDEYTNTNQQKMWFPLTLWINLYLCIQKSYPRYKLVLNGAKLWKPYSRDLHRSKDITYWKIVLYQPGFSCWWHHLEEKQKTAKSWFPNGIRIFYFLTKHKIRQYRLDDEVYELSARL